MVQNLVGGRLSFFVFMRQIESNLYKRIVSAWNKEELLSLRVCQGQGKLQ